MSINFKNVNITSGFWKEMQEKNISTTINAVYKRFDETGRFEAMKCNWKEGMEKKPHIYWDSDVAKWIEGAAYILSKNYDAELEAKVESIIDDIEENQDEYGYFNVYYTVVEPEKRFKNRLEHELYCAGHLIEAAVTYYETCGKDRLLTAMTKYADYIYKVFVTDKSAAFVTPGHEEIELALLRLYRCTENKKYFELCKFFIENRGKHNEEVYDFVNGKHAQDEMPVRELTSADGHAVRAVYLYTAMADLAKEANDKELFDTCKTLFGDIVNKKMCITGGIGASHLGEAFTVPYDLPNETAYNETCASIGMTLFADRMLKNDINSLYADIIEKEIYNGIISGISLDGKAFFYENPLEVNIRNHQRHVSVHKGERLPITQRKEVFWCSCCPPNLNRFIASVEQYIYGERDGVFYVHQYTSSKLDDGTHKISQKTEYPANGKIELHCEGVDEIALRIPYWCDSFTLNAPYELKNGYAYVKAPADLELCLNMEAKLYMANPEVDACSGKVALMYGPVVYCIEGADNNENLHNVYIGELANLEFGRNEELNCQTVSIDAYKRSASQALYQPINNAFEKIRIKFIPYHLFANRTECDMLVWVNYR